LNRSTQLAAYMKKDQTQSKTDFNHYADDYNRLLKESTKMSGYDPGYFDEHKIKTVHADISSAKTAPAKAIRIMNFGCGIGKSEQYINKYFPGSQIVSADVSEKSIEMAKEANKELDNVRFIVFDKIEELQPGMQFDIIFVANVFHHIPEELHVNILRHLRSLLSPGGSLYVFEHNPINPLTRKVFETCEFDAGCKMIPSPLFISMCKEAGYTSIRRNFVLFFPKALSALAGLERFLKWCPVGAQYYIKAH
jgi:SAM-dependent methyltransferase